jgi:hypothetical protein
VRCPTCDRPEAICVCDKVHPLACATRVLVLQHPQEPDQVLGTAQLLAAGLPHCRVRVGLSWPNLTRAWGDDAAPEGRWAVLWRGSLPEGTDPALERAPVARVDAKGAAVPASVPLGGIIALDGTWSQGKTLWWRNPWLLRLDRVLLSPAEPGLYGRLRKEPHRQAVSTLEAVGDALAAFADGGEVRAELRRWMRTMVQRARDTDPRKAAARAPSGPPERGHAGDGEPT